MRRTQGCLELARWTVIDLDLFVHEARRGREMEPTAPKAPFSPAVTEKPVKKARPLPCIAVMWVPANHRAQTSDVTEIQNRHGVSRGCDPAVVAQSVCMYVLRARLFATDVCMF